MYRRVRGFISLYDMYFADHAECKYTKPGDFRKGLFIYQRAESLEGPCASVGKLLASAHKFLILSSQLSPPICAADKRRCLFPFCCSAVVHQQCCLLCSFPSLRLIVEQNCKECYQVPSNVNRRHLRRVQQGREANQEPVLEYT